MRSVIAAALLFLCGCFSTGANAACPAGYFEANANGIEIRDLKAGLSTTICVLLKTTASEISARMKVSGNIVGTGDLERALQSKVLQGAASPGGPGCGGGRSAWWSALVPTAQDFQLIQANLTLRRSGSQSKIDALLKIAETSRLMSAESFVVGTIAASATLKIAQAGDNLTLSVDKMKITSTRLLRPFQPAAVANAVTDCLNGLLAARPFNPYAALHLVAPLEQDFYRATNPSIDGVSLLVTGNRLAIQADFSATLKKPDADKMLAKAVSGWSFDDLLKAFQGRSGPTS